MGEITMLTKLIALGCDLHFDLLTGTAEGPWLRLKCAYGAFERTYVRTPQTGASGLVFAAWRDFGDPGTRIFPTGRVR